MAKRSGERAGPGDSSPAWRQRAVTKSLRAARTRAEQRVERLLHAASDLMDEKGTTDFTIQEVVDRSGQSLRGFYQYFEGKDELLFALLEENIRQCIGIIIGTPPGERQMLPPFGCRVYELLFAPSTPATAAQVSYFVREALDRWEPRIEVLDVSSTAEPNSGGIKVKVQYKMRAPSAVTTLSYAVANR